MKLEQNDSCDQKMLLIKFFKYYILFYFYSSLTSGGSSNRAMEIPMSGGGPHGGFNGLNPFPYNSNGLNSMSNSMPNR